MKILIVEDQAILAMELEYVLAEAGHAVVGCAMDAPEALAMAAAARPDVALVDINLRDGVTGPSVARTLAERLEATVVFLTANPEQIPEAFGGAIGALIKPFDEAAVRAVVAFAGQYRREGVVGVPPTRFQPAPGLESA